mmetsp:Transcript_30170/g.53964  ORF Transcript_30170/g.53964 Transcript_30170/m.53964 type:complete len:183 (-) Transcript_30170:2-550(-)
MAEGGIHPVPNRGKRKWIYTATCFTCTAGLWVVLRFIISHYHLSTSWMEMEVGELLMSEPEPDDSGVVHEDTSIPLNPTSNWPEPCLTNYTHTKGEEVPVMDLVRAAMAELANSSLFILQRDLQKSTWGGPGPLPKKRHTIDRVPPLAFLNSSPIFREGGHLHPSHQNTHFPFDPHRCQMCR